MHNIDSFIPIFRMHSGECRFPWPPHPDNKRSTAIYVQKCTHSCPVSFYCIALYATAPFPHHCGVRDWKPSATSNESNEYLLATISSTYLPSHSSKWVMDCVEPLLQGNGWSNYQNQCRCLHCQQSQIRPCLIMIEHRINKNGWGERLHVSFSPKKYDMLGN